MVDNWLTVLLGLWIDAAGFKSEYLKKKVVDV